MQGSGFCRASGFRGFSGVGGILKSFFNAVDYVSGRELYGEMSGSARFCRGRGRFPNPEKLIAAIPKPCSQDHPETLNPEAR